MHSRRNALLLLAAAALPIGGCAVRRDHAQVLRVGMSASPVRLDPLLTTMGDEYVYANLVFNGLTRLNEDNGIEPDLAQNWAAADEFHEWTFGLRRGVSFHDGSQFVADDVVGVFQRLLDPNTAAPAASSFAMVRRVEALDPWTVRFTLDFPYHAFPGLLSDRQVKIVPRSKVGSMETRPVGSGPFRFVSYTPGDRLILEKNPFYFEQGLPCLDGVELLIIPEVSAKIAALQSGDLDVIWDLPLEHVRALSMDRTLRIDSVPSGAWDAAVMNNNITPFHDGRVRRAFHLGVSKQDVVDLALFGQGQPTISPIPPWHPFFAKDIPIRPADVRGARQLLSSAGYPNGLQLQLIVPIGRPVREMLGVALQQFLRPAGFDLQIHRVPYSQYASEVSGRAPLYIEGFFGRPTIDGATYPYLHSEGTWNGRLWHYHDPEVDEALAAARLSADTEVQRTQYQRMQHALDRNPASFFAYSANFACAYRAGVRGVRTHPLRWFDLRRATLA